MKPRPHRPDPRRLAVILVLVALPQPLAAEDLRDTMRDENDIWLHGSYIDTLNDRNLAVEPGDLAKVCAMRYRSSVLALRNAPSAGAPEIAALPYYAEVVLTGAISTDLKWLQISGYWLSFDTLGQRIDPQPDGPVRLSEPGWADARYLCHFLD